ncbi:ScyD/ScyE family protein [Nocardioides coralli]|uniref:ScyD/ScyE family protein n=1 Tax=Nocardioides coralli TaxID=2872154 RepID=UPI001CA40637|nr:ScyD/ScyE family protein [Nocardioides coralli]QZY28137.1 ScyD/ScyE family protein [Nocardioides coralli]
MKARNRRARLGVLAGTTALVISSTLTAAPTAADDSAWEEVASGLDNPRLLSFRGNRLFVAEAGTGGSGPCLTSPEGEVCYGPSGAITRIRNGHQRRVVTHLPSLAGPDGGGAIGPADVQALGWGKLAISIGLGNEPAVRDLLPRRGRRLMGTVAAGRVHRKHLRVLADLAHFEEKRDPDGEGADSNPTGMVVRGRHIVATDSGGNTLVKAAAAPGQSSSRGGGRHRIRALAVFDSPGTVPNPFPGPPPSFDMQSVPTSVIPGRGGWFVSELTGFPFAPGFARIHHVPRGGGAPTVYADGLTNVTDLAWYRGDLYAVQIADGGLLTPGLPMGSLVRVLPGGGSEPVAGPFPAPYGVAIRGGAAYVTTCSVCAGGGSVMRVPLP